MARKYQNLKDYLSQPGQTVVGLMRQFNAMRIKENKPRVSVATMYNWSRGDTIPTKDWDIKALSAITGIPEKKLFNF